MANQHKRKLVIFSSSYPYGLTETFLHNEILYLAEFYDIELFPVMKQKEADKPRSLPANVSFNKPFLSINYYKRVINGIFNLSPLLPYIIDLFKLLRYSKNLKLSIKEWFIHLLVFRTVYASVEFLKTTKDPEKIKYFYWGNFPLGLIKGGYDKIFMRIHGGEVDFRRHHSYIPMASKKIVKHTQITYIPISNNCVQNMLSIRTVNYELNRLGVYDNGVNPYVKDSEEISVLSCSNLIPLKRVHLILKALAKIKDVRIKWVHFGDGELLKNLESESRTLPGNICVDFKGRVDNSIVLNYYKSESIDLFINVSETEGVPVSIMEAFSFGVPCFATNVGGTSEIVDESNGYLAPKHFEINELESFIRNIKKLSKEKDYRYNARRTWKEKYNAKVNYGKLNQLLN